MQTVSEHHYMFLQKNVDRKKRQPKLQCSMLRECQIIYNDVDTHFDFNSTNELEVFKILRNFSEDNDNDFNFDFDSEEETFAIPHYAPIIQLDF